MQLPIILVAAFLLCCSFSTTTSYTPFPTYTALGGASRYIDAPFDYFDSFQHHPYRRPSPSLAASSPPIVNVDEFISASHGDHTTGFLRAWQKACETQNAVLVVPKGKIYTLKPITFLGPCVSPVTVQIYGTIKASDDMSCYEADRKHWIKFMNIRGLMVSGGGVVDGSGAIWWRSSCKRNPAMPCTEAPNAMTFYGCEKLLVKEIMLQNAQQMHLRIEDCVDATTDKVKISSPGDSPNTDGIHVSGSKNVLIQSSVIATGDDCISIVSGSTHVQALDTICGPGHGISIGSLGKYQSAAQVSDILVNGATLSGTTNGVRIKSWQGGSGYAEGITFQNVVMKNVSNPIIIDQNYCDQDKPCQSQDSAVQVSNVKYMNIKGTSNSDYAIDLNCSVKYLCTGIVLQDVELTSQERGDKAEASCKNVLLKRVGEVNPHC